MDKYRVKIETDNVNDTWYRLEKKSLWFWVKVDNTLSRSLFDVVKLFKQLRKPSISYKDIDANGELGQTYK